jgi:hypothetical protein
MTTAVAVTATASAAAATAAVEAAASGGVPELASRSTKSASLFGLQLRTLPNLVRLLCMHLPLMRGGATALPLERERRFLNAHYSTIRLVVDTELYVTNYITQSRGPSNAPGRPLPMAQTSGEHVASLHGLHKAGACTSCAYVLLLCTPPGAPQGGSPLKGSAPSLPSCARV